MKYKAGDKARIVGNTRGNKFSLGEIVYLDYQLQDSKYFLAKNQHGLEYYVLPCDFEPIEPVQEEESQLDYPAAARAIAVWLKEFCDENLSYPDMVAECARRASKEISRLKSEIEELKRKA